MSDQIVFLEKLDGQLAREVLSLVLDVLVRLGYLDAGALARCRAANTTREYALATRELFLASTEEARVRDLGSVSQRREGREPEVDASS
jgi:hypothetical protein